MQRPPIFWCILCNAEKRKGSEYTCCSGVDCNSRDCICKYCDPERTKFYCSDACKPASVVAAEEAAAAKKQNKKKRARAPSLNSEIIQKSLRFDTAKQLHDEIAALQTQIEQDQATLTELDAGMKESICAEVEKYRRLVETEKETIDQTAQSLRSLVIELEQMMRDASWDVVESDLSVFENIVAKKKEHESGRVKHVEFIKQHQTNMFLLKQHQDAEEHARKEQEKKQRRLESAKQKLEEAKGRFEALFK